MPVYIIVWILLLTCIDGGYKIGDRINLQENIIHISDISIIAVVNDESFVAFSNMDASVILYNSRGEQVKRVGRHGRGPFEYERPSVVKAFDDQIFIWDSSLLKLLVFSSTGDPVQEIKYKTTLIKDFAVSENYIAFYITGNASEGFIRIFDRKSGEKLTEIGKVDSEFEYEYQLHMMYTGSGKIAFHGDDLYFVLPINTKVWRYSVSTGLLESFEIEDEDFHLTKTNYTSQAQLSSDMSNAMLYPFMNSRSLGIVNMGDMLGLVVENGVYQDGDLGSFWQLPDTRRKVEEPRNMNLYLFDKDFEGIKKIDIPRSFHEEYGLHLLGTGNKKLFFYKESGVTDEELLRTLNIVEVCG